VQVHHNVTSPRFEMKELDEINMVSRAHLAGAFGELLG
jgi:hypothetical protein